MKKAYEAHGDEGLAPRVRRKPIMPNRTPAALEEHILSKTKANPTVSYIRLAGQIQLEGISVTPGMVRYVWQREGLSTRAARIQWVRKMSRQGRPSGRMGDFVEARVNLQTDHSSVSPGSIPVSVG